MLTVKELAKKRKTASIVCACFISLSVSALYYYFNLFNYVDLFLYDLNSKFHAGYQQSEEIVLVLIDEKSARELTKYRRNWSRWELSEAVAHLSEARAAIIALDMFFLTPSSDPEEDKALASAMEQAGNVVLTRIASNHSEIKPLAIYQDVMLGDGFIDMPLDIDNVLRRVRFLQAKPTAEGGMELIPSFALEIARAYLNLDFLFDFSSQDHFLIGSPESGQLRLPYPDLLINFDGNDDIFKQLSYYDVVKGSFDPAIVKDKIVLIGTTLIADRDFFETPVTRFQTDTQKFLDRFKEVVVTGSGGREPGVACHAHAVNTILKKSFITRIKTEFVLTAVFLATVCCSVFYLPNINILRLALCYISLLSLVIAIQATLFSYRFWLETAPVFSVISLHFFAALFIERLFERRKSSLITSMFGRYVSETVAKRLVKGEIDSSMQGKRSELTILFSDLRSFTTLSEKLGAQQTSTLLNFYFSNMLPIVFKHNGTLDKLIGDGIMAFWGAPEPQNDHASKAAFAALNMLKKLELMKVEHAEIEGIKGLRLGIGLNTGEVTVGNMGSQEFLDYTVIGDPVNLASRTESINKVYGTNILITDHTRRLLTDEFITREIDTVQVKGKTEPVVIFELMGLRTDTEAAMLLHKKELFENALMAYKSKEITSAHQRFEETLVTFPQDPPSLFYLKRLNEIMTNPDYLGTWKAITVMESK